MKYAKLQYSLSRVSGNHSGKKHRFQAYIKKAGLVKNRKFATIVADGAGRSVEEVEYILGRTMSAARDCLLQGYDVRIGDIVLRSVITGSFPTKDAVYDPERNSLQVVAQALKGIRHCFPADTETENLVTKPAPVIHSCGDSAHGKRWKLHVGGVAYMQGKYIATDKNRPDEGITLLDPSTMETVATATILRSDEQLIDFTFESWPSPGEYLICLATRNGFDTDYSVAKVSKPVTVV